MNKRITSLLLSVVMICSLLVSAVPAWAAADDSGVTASVSQASPGDTFSVTLKVPGTTKQISDMSLKVLFDKSVFEVTEYTIPSIEGMSKMQSTVAEANSNSFFSATYDSESSDADITFAGIELTAKFKVKDGAALGESVFKLDESVGVGSLDDMGLPDILMKLEDFTNKSATIKIVSAPKPATGIALNKDTLTVWEGGSDSLIATVTPSDSTDTVVWSSDNTSVATVDNTGNVTGVAVGTAKITATAGTKSATCKVTVPCIHNHTIIPAKASDCTNRGWDEYMVCSKCNALQKPTGEILSGIPYRPLDTNAHDFDTTTWGYKGADGHAYTCTRNSEHHDTVYPHNPDRTAPTETEPQTCTQCGYVIAAATGHIHANHLTLVAAKAATCTSKGNMAYYKCNCGKYFKDATAAVEITDISTMFINASGHSYTVQNSDAAHKRSTASDCREYDTYWYTCANDASHNAKDDATATDKYYNGDRGAHAYSTDWTACGESGHAHKCLYDDSTNGLTTHRPDRAVPTETEAVKCLDCDYIIKPETGHVHANHLTYVAAKAATCTTAGNKEYYECNCGKYFKDATAAVEITDISTMFINASGHSYTVQNSDAAHKRSTASDCREYDTYWYTCANDASHNAKDDATATDKYYNGDRGAHAYSTDWTACGESGHAHKCLYDDNTVDLTAHRPDRTEPTETEAVKCLDCGYVITPELGHTHSLVKVEGKNADCNENGMKEHYKCESCNKLFEDATGSAEITDESTLVIPATGHSFVWVTDKEATEAETGLKHEECTVCHEKRNENTVIDKLVKADKADSASKNNAEKSPKTGDDSSMGAWVAILFVSGGVLLVTGFYCRKRRSRAE